MKTEEMKVLLYLKKSGLDKFGKAPIMGRITIGRSITQFSCKYLVIPIYGIPVRIVWMVRAARQWRLTES